MSHSLDNSQSVSSGLSVPDGLQERPEIVRLDNFETNFIEHVPPLCRVALGIL